VSRLRRRQRAGVAVPLAWALLVSLAVHAALLGWSAPQRVPASALSRLEVRLESGAVSAAWPAEVKGAEPGEARRAGTPLQRPRAQVPAAESSGFKKLVVEPAPSAARQSVDAALPPAAAAAVPLDSAGGHLTLPQAVRAVYRQVGGPGQRELVWRLDGGHYALQWTERRAGSAVTARASARGVLSYAGLLPLSYRELRPGQEVREWQFDWGVGVVQRTGADPAKDEPVVAGDQDPLSLLMQLAVVHQVLAEAPRRAGVLLAVAGVGAVSARYVPALDAAGRARYEFDPRGPGLRIVALELATEHALLPVQLEELDGAGRTVWQLAALENLDAD
jgi:hypothetical protein